MRRFHPENLVLPRENTRTIPREDLVLPRKEVRTVLPEDPVLPRKQVRAVLTEVIKVSKEIVPNAVESKILANEDVAIRIPFVAKQIALVISNALQAHNMIEGHDMSEKDVVTGQVFSSNMNLLTEPTVVNTVVSEVVTKIEAGLAGDLPDGALTGKAKSNVAQDHDSIRRSTRILDLESASRVAAPIVDGRIRAEIDCEAVDIFCQEDDGSDMQVVLSKYNHLKQTSG
jgi:hypothetical protein